jgi:hypothetical protein
MNLNNCGISTGIRRLFELQGGRSMRTENTMSDSEALLS